MQQFAFCYAVITAFCLVFGSIITSKLGEDVGAKTEVTYFRRMVHAYLLFCAGELIFALGNFKLAPIPVPVLSAVSMLSMIAVGFITFYWFCYGETKMGYRFIEVRSIRAVILIPLIVAVVLYAVSPFTGWMYYYNETGQFVQGPLYALAIPLEQIYLVVVSVQALIKALHSTGKQRSEYLNIFLFIIIPALACIFDAIIPTMPVIAPAIFSSIFFVFLGIQESRIFNDSLTGLNNRRRANIYLDEEIANTSAEDPVFVFMMDINAFKHINDTYGHLEGDRALRVVADAIKDTCAELRAFVARWGGDEFIIVAHKSFIHSPESLVEKLHASVEAARTAAGLEYPLTLSIGYAQCTTPDTSQEALEHEADEMLYANKEAFYAAQAVPETA